MLHFSTGRGTIKCRSHSHKKCSSLSGDLGIGGDRADGMEGKGEQGEESLELRLLISCSCLKQKEGKKKQQKKGTDTSTACYLNGTLFHIDST